MEALALKSEAVNLIENLPDSKVRYVIQFTKFISQQDSLGKESQDNASKKRLPLGFLKGKAKVRFSDDWEMTEAELLGL